MVEAHVPVRVRRNDASSDDRLVVVVRRSLERDDGVGHGAKERQRNAASQQRIARERRWPRPLLEEVGPLDRDLPRLGRHRRRILDHPERRRDVVLRGKPMGDGLPSLARVVGAAGYSRGHPVTVHTRVRTAKRQ
jgi:hypothetical protein